MDRAPLSGVHLGRASSHARLRADFTRGLSYERLDRAGDVVEGWG